MKCLLFVLLVITQLGLSQEPNYKQYTTSNGLPSSEVYDIIQDDYGYLWFSTDHGLCRYDGYEFDYYDTENGLTDNTIFKFTKDHHGKIWCTAFNNTIFSIEGKSPVFKQYPYNHELQKLSSEYVLNELMIGDDGTFYINCLNALNYLSIHKNGKVDNYLKKPVQGIMSHGATIKIGAHKCFSFATYSPKNRELNIVQSLLITNIDSLGAGRSPKGVKNPDESIFLKYGKEVVGFFPNGNSMKLPQGFEVDNIGIWDKTHFWISCRGGGIRVYSFMGELKKEILKGLSVSSIYRDHEGGIWASTLQNGVFHLINEGVSSYQVAKGEPSVNELFYQEGRGLWVALASGDIYNLNDGSSRLFLKPELNRYSGFSYDEKRNLLYYFSEKKVGLVGEDKQWQTGPILGMKINLLPSDTLIKYGNFGVWQVHSGRDIKLPRTKDIELYHEKVYVATKIGFMVMDGDQGRKVDFDNELLNSRIEDLQLFNENLALASRGIGLILFNGKEVVRHISRKEGLSSNFVNKLYKENESTLWACTNKGLNRLTFENDGTYSIQIFDYDNGLLSNEINDVVVANDTVWVGTRGGLCSFRVSDFMSSRKQTNYRLRFENIKINDETRSLKKTFDLNHASRRIEIKFSGTSFLEGADLEYRYKLDGLEDKWIYSKQRTVLYSSLNPGNYTFIVQVKGENEDWAEEIRMNIYIAPPFWTTWWFILSMIVSVVLIVYLFFRYRVLQYNRDILRELVRQFTKRLRRSKPHIIVKESGMDVKIHTADIKYIKSDGNYIEIYTIHKKHVIREKIGNFLGLVPDPIEFLQIRRSFIIRIDRITGKGKKHVIVEGEKLEVGNTYVDQLEKIDLS